MTIKKSKRTIVPQRTFRQIREAYNAFISLSGASRMISVGHRSIKLLRRNHSFNNLSFPLHQRGRLLSKNFSNGFWRLRCFYLNILLFPVRKSRTLQKKKQNAFVSLRSIRLQLYVWNNYSRESLCMCIALLASDPTDSAWKSYWVAIFLDGSACHGLCDRVILYIWVTILWQHCFD